MKVLKKHIGTAGISRFEAGSLWALLFPVHHWLLIPLERENKQENQPTIELTN